MHMMLLAHQKRTDLLNLKRQTDSTTFEEPVTQSRREWLTAVTSALPVLIYVLNKVWSIPRHSNTIPTRSKTLQH